MSEVISLDYPLWIGTRKGIRYLKVGTKVIVSDSSETPTLSGIFLYRRHGYLHYYDYSTCNLYPCVSPFKDTSTRIFVDESRKVSLYPRDNTFWGIKYPCSVTYKMLPGSIITNEIPTNLTDVDIIFDI